MAYEQKDNSGSLFKNKRKTEENHPDSTGSVKIDGKEYWLNGWTKTTKDGEKGVSLSLKPKEAQRPAPAYKPDPAAGTSFEGMKDDIPF